MTIATAMQRAMMVVDSAIAKREGEGGEERESEGEREEEGKGGREREREREGGRGRKREREGERRGYGKNMKSNVGRWVCASAGMCRS